MKTVLILTLILVCGGAGLWVQEKAIRAVQKENAALQATLQEKTGKEVEVTPVTSNTMSPEDKLELLRLRRLVARLREEARTSISTPETLLKEAAEENRKADFLLAGKEAESLSKQTRNSIQTLAGMSRAVTRTTGAPINSFADLQQAASHPGLQPNLRSGISNLFTAAPGQMVTWETFEFTTAYDTHGNMTNLLRERLARKFPDGKHAKFYALPNGRVVEALEETPNFQTWESTELPQLLSNTKRR